MNPFITSNPPKTVQELFANESRWTQGDRFDGARDEHGEFVGGKHHTACCFCLGVAIGLVYGPKECLTYIEKAKEVLRDKYNFFGKIPAWNDSPGRTIEEVREVARLANI